MKRYDEWQNNKTRTGYGADLGERICRKKSSTGTRLKLVSVEMVI